MFKKSILLSGVMSVAFIFSATACHIMSGEDVDTLPEKTVQTEATPSAAPSKPVKTRKIQADEEDEVEPVANSLKMVKPKKIKINRQDGYLAYEKNLFRVELTEKSFNGNFWGYSDDNPEPLMEITNDYYAVKPNENSGIPGKRVFAFRTLNEGTAKLNFGFIEQGGKLDSSAIKFSLLVYIDEEGLIYRVEQK